MISSAVFLYLIAEVTFKEVIGKNKVIYRFPTS